MRRSRRSEPVEDLARDETVTLEELRIELARRHPSDRGLAKVVLARSARRGLLKLEWPLINAVADALTLLERDPDAGYELRGVLPRAPVVACRELPDHLPAHRRGSDGPDRVDQTSRGRVFG